MTKTGIPKKAGREPMKTSPAPTTGVRFRDGREVSKTLPTPGTKKPPVQPSNPKKP
jgi:hypothetical protein